MFILFVENRFPKTHFKLPLDKFLNISLTLWGISTWISAWGVAFLACEVDLTAWPMITELGMEAERNTIRFSIPQLQWTITICHITKRFCPTLCNLISRCWLCILYTWYYVSHCTSHCISCILLYHYTNPIISHKMVDFIDTSPCCWLKTYHKNHFVGDLKKTVWWSNKSHPAGQGAPQCCSEFWWRL